MATTTLLRSGLRLPRTTNINPLTRIHLTTTATTTKMSTRPQSTFRTYLIDPADLHSALQTNAPTTLSTAPRTVPLSAAWFLPNDPQARTGQQTYRAAHIPTARFFNLDTISDTTSPYPHMLPSPQTFSAAMSELGVKRDDVLVVYDTAELGIFSAPRVAWTLKAFGHPAVHVLNNFKLWVEQGYPVESGEQARVERTEYPVPELDRTRVAGFEQVREVARDANKEGNEGIQILDARSKGRWEGREAEPRPGLSSGHMPGSISVPVPELLDPETKAFLPAQELRKVFERKGVDSNRPIISSCGTGVTAVVIDAALTAAGYGEGNRRVYDGSWTEWAQRVQPTENLIVKSD
ncbi:hypothetical protein B0A50_07302 [Salinomyces thailandicus]|uniref:Rhodanese domain-containing protein n=1 Tax=Salinomyces thailandicus TaxID=706561 RepID=A0A4U0TNM9_9PEZI|nr:hypothetical protein B0A50_07302 [Salinomyces thailandica]